ncbi:MAG: hypothetical protein ABSH51_26140 [Solirubrobacteraceae bacterium]
MRRVILLAAILISLLASVAANGQTSLPTLLAAQIRTVHRDRNAPPVLLAGSMPLDVHGLHLYPSAGTSGARYDLSIGAVAHCGDATVCFVADFSATKSGKVFGTPVSVRGASRAGFVALSCGASCAPPEIDFLLHGDLYVIQANLTSTNDRLALIDAAQAAIAAGPR